MTKTIDNPFDIQSSWNNSINSWHEKEKNTMFKSGELLYSIYDNPLVIVSDKIIMINGWKHYTCYSVKSKTFVDFPVTMLLRCK